MRAFRACQIMRSRNVALPFKKNQMSHKWCNSYGSQAIGLTGRCHQLVWSKDGFTAQMIARRASRLKSCEG